MFLPYTILRLSLRKDKPNRSNYERLEESRLGNRRAMGSTALGYTLCERCDMILEFVIGTFALGVLFLMFMGVEEGSDPWDE